MLVYFFFFNDPPTTEIYTLSLHDALPISSLLTQNSSNQRLENRGDAGRFLLWPSVGLSTVYTRSEEHTSELQSRRDLVCRLLLEKKKYTILIRSNTHLICTTSFCEHHIAH